MEKNQKKPRLPEKDDLSYEKDPRFVAFIKDRLEKSYDRSRLIDGQKATDDIRKKLGLSKIYGQL
jgi:hypothetical protein